MVAGHRAAARAGALAKDRVLMLPQTLEVRLKRQLGQAHSL